MKEGVAVLCKMFAGKSVECEELYSESESRNCPVCKKALNEKWKVKIL